MGCNLASAILRTIAYADVLDYPLTAGEFARYLEGVSCPPNWLEALARDPRLSERAGGSAEYFFLSDRGHIVDIRRTR